jgi:hypothetical protein
MAKDKRWMQKAAKKMKKKGTVGSFTRWCKAHGYGGVTSAAIAAGLRAGGKIAKKAAFAKAARKARHAQGGMIEDEFGLGGWIKDNIGGVMGGLKTLGGAALMATGFGAPIGAGLIGSGIGDIVGEIKGDQMTGQQEELYGQQMGAQRAMMQKQKQDEYLAGVGGSENPFTPTFAFGGTMPLVPAEVEDDEVLRSPRGKLKKVSGRTHGQGGIDVMEEPGTLVYSDREIFKETGRTYAEEADIIRRRIAQLDKQLA